MDVSTAGGSTPFSLASEDAKISVIDAANDTPAITLPWVTGIQGSADGSFDSDGEVMTPITTDGDDTGRAVAIQDDGKIVVAGYVDDGSYHNFAVVRYNSNGSLDDGTGNDSTPGDQFGDDNTGIVITDIAWNDYAHSVAIQEDGKIVVAGQSDGDFVVVRYNSDGSLDDGTVDDLDDSDQFGSDNTGIVITDLGAYDVAYSVAVQSDGKIVLAGVHSDADADFAVVRYNSDGSLDDGTVDDLDDSDQFGSDNTGIVTTDFSGNQDKARSVNIQSDGKIVVAGYADNGSDYDFAVARYNIDGSLDDGTVNDLDDSDQFGSDGTVIADFSSSNDWGYSAAIQADGKIVVAGYADTGSDYDFALARFNTDGSLDDGTVNDLDDSDEFRLRRHGHGDPGRIRHGLHRLRLFRRDRFGRQDSRRG